MEDSLVPPPRSLRVFRIIANHVQQRPRRADAYRLGILRHQQHMAALLLPDLAHKVAKRFSTRYIQRAARRAPVPVSAGDDRTLPSVRQLLDAIVLFGAASPIKFEGVQELHRTRQKSIEIIPAPFHPYARLRPQRMVEDDQNIRESIEH